MTPMDEIRACRKGLSVASGALATALAAQIALASLLALGTVILV